MSSGRRSTWKSQSATQKTGGKSDKPQLQFLPALKPRPLLAIVLFVVLVLWLVGLVMLRFKAVKPYIHPTTASAAP